MTLKRSLGCLLVLTLASGILWAQNGPKVAHTKGSAAPTQRWNPPAGHSIIWTNLGPSFTNLYNAAAGGYYVLGPSNSVGLGEQWIGLQFTPTKNVSATQLVVSVGIISGTSLVDVGLYSDAGGTVGTLLASGHTTKIPVFGTCCGVVLVTIPSTALTNGTQYWIAATSDDTNAADFTGAFSSSNQGNIAYNPSQQGWFGFNGLVPGVAILQ
jgi:hypothetical protein